MKLYSEKENCYKLYHGSMLDMTEAIELNSIDSIVTDPPYELNFMNKGWDNSGIAFQSDTWKKCFDVLKPGGYLLAFGGSRTFHRIACAIEDAGFEIRDTIMWLYGSGFPKSMNIGLAIDKKNGVESKVVGTGKSGSTSKAFNLTEEQEKAGTGVLSGEYSIKKAQNGWNGWGTALKPSYEPIIVARKPVDGSITDNVLKNGVGGINIDECRVDAETNRRMCGITEKSGETSFILGAREETYTNKGRFPANTILTYDESTYDEVCGNMPYTKNSGAPLTMPDLRDVGRKSKEAIGVDKLSFGQVRNAKRKPYVYAGREYDNKDTSMFNGDKPQAPSNYNDEGSASRYFKNCEFTEKDNEETLLPQYESIIVARKPCEGSTTDNVLKYGVGGINIDECRVPLEDGYEFKQTTRHPRTNDVFTDETCGFKAETNTIASANPNGRFPANTILTYDETDFDEVCGGFPDTKSTGGSGEASKKNNFANIYAGGWGKEKDCAHLGGLGDEGSAARYFYCAKASKKDRDEGLNGFAEQKMSMMATNANIDKDGNFTGMLSGRNTKLRNIHPTVKPTTLMQYLIRLVTPNGGTVLDPFNGSGSTGKAVMYENRERNKGYKYIGIELTEEYLPISKARIEYAINSDISIILNNSDQPDAVVDAATPVIKKNKLW